MGLRSKIALGATGAGLDLANQDIFSAVGALGGKAALGLTELLRSPEAEAGELPEGEKMLKGFANLAAKASKTGGLISKKNLKQAAKESFLGAGLAEKSSKAAANRFEEMSKAFRDASGNVDIEALNNEILQSNIFAGTGIKRFEGLPPAIPDEARTVSRPTTFDPESISKPTPLDDALEVVESADLKRVPDDVPAGGRFAEMLPFLKKHATAKNLGKGAVGVGLAALGAMALKNTMNQEKTPIVEPVLETPEPVAAPKERRKMPKIRANLKGIDRLIEERRKQRRR